LHDYTILGGMLDLYYTGGMLDVGFEPNYCWFL